MTISLKKREPISLKKNAPALDRIQLGIEWKTNTPKFDVDIQAFICEQRTKKDGSVGSQLISDTFCVFFNNQESADGSFKSAGDDRGSTGGGSEAIDGILSKIDPRATEVVFTATIDKADVRKQSFGQCSGGRVYILNTDTDETLAEWSFGPGAFSTETALHLGSLYIGESGDWEFMAVGEGGVKSFEDIAVEDYGFPTD